MGLGFFNSQTYSEGAMNTDKMYLGLWSLLPLFDNIGDFYILIVNSQSADSHLTAQIKTSPDLDLPLITRFDFKKSSEYFLPINS